MRPLASRSMHPERRRVLVLAYFFPPLGGAGVQRTLKFVKYLAPLGWRATVVSTRSRLYPARDPSLLAEVPDSVRVVRTPALPVAHWASLVAYRLRLMRVFAWLTWPDGGFGWLPFCRRLRAACWHDASARTSCSRRPRRRAHTSPRWSSTGSPGFRGSPTFATSGPPTRIRVDQPRALARLAARVERAITSRAARVVVAADYFDLAGALRRQPAPCRDHERRRRRGPAARRRWSRARGGSCLLTSGRCTASATRVLSSPRLPHSSTVARSTGSAWWFGLSDRCGSRGSSRQPGSRSR